MKVIGEQFIHSSHIQYVGADRHDAVFVKVNQFMEDGSVVPTLRKIHRPKRRFWVTKKGMQSVYSEKKEWEVMHNLDEFTVHNDQLPAEAFRALNGYAPGGYIDMRKLAKSPYLYGSDISVDSLIKHRMDAEFKKTKLSPRAITTGGFDTETSMFAEDHGKLIMATITHEDQVYTSVLRSFFKSDKTSTNDQIKENIEDMIEKIMIQKNLFPSKEAQKAIGDREFVYNVHIAEEPIDILRYTIGKMHENKTDYMTVWNLGFDIAVVLKTCEDAGVDPGEILAPEIVPKEYRKFNFKVDHGKKGDIPSRRWHWLYGPSYAQWIDSMCLYSILRIVSGYETSYALDHILRKNKVSDGKLTFKDELPTEGEMTSADWHRFMQSDHPYEYVLYNIFDVIGMQVLEWINKDLVSMNVLLRNTPCQNFNKQTRRSADEMYFNHMTLKPKRVIAATAAWDSDEYEIEKKGGAVLPAERAYKAGAKVLREARSRDTNVHLHVNDLDFSALYPNNSMLGNISRETKKAMILDIEGHDREEVRNYLSMYLAVDENAVPMCQQFFNLPGYQDMEDLFKEHLQTTNER